MQPESMGLGAGLAPWLALFMDALDKNFGQRVCFAGLQGSYARGEATKDSDIDVVVILDTLSPQDIHRYSAMLDTLPNRQLVCGFLSGKEEIARWPASDLFQFYHDTRPLKGSLSGLLPAIGEADIRQAIKTEVGNIYHGCVHNMLHTQGKDMLKGLYKSALFAIQALHYLHTGHYIAARRDLLKVVPKEEQAIVLAYIGMQNGEEMDFQTLSAALFSWAGKQLRNV